MFLKFIFFHLYTRYRGSILIDIPVSKTVWYFQVHIKTSETYLLGTINTKACLKQLWYSLSMEIPGHAAGTQQTRVNETRNRLRI